MTVQKQFEDFQKPALPPLKKDLESELSNILKKDRGRIRYILKIKRRAEEHKNIEKRKFKQRLNTFSHMSGDSGDLKKLGFTKTKYGYTQFFSLSKKERNKYLDKIITTCENILREKKLKENKKQVKCYNTDLPKSSSATKLKNTYQYKKQEIEEKFQIQKTKKKLERLRKKIGDIEIP